MAGTVDAPYDAPLDVELTQIQGFSGALLDGGAAELAGASVARYSASELPDLPPVPILPVLPPLPSQ